MERFDYSASLHQVAKDKYDRIKNNYGKNSRAPFGNICPTFDEVLNYLIVVLYRLNYNFISQKSFDLMIYKVILDFFRSLSVTRALVDQDRYHTSIYFNTFNPHKLSFYYDAKRILQGRFSRWTKKLADVGVDETSLVDNVGVKLFNRCNEIDGAIIGLTHRMMINDVYDGLRRMGVYGRLVTQEDGLNAETTDSPNIIGPKRIPVNKIDTIDIPESHFDIPDEISDDVLADNGVDTDLRYQIDRNPLTFWMTVAEIGEHIKGFADEFSAVVAHSYPDKNNCITKKQACENVARAFGLPVATVTSHFYRSMEKAERMGSKKAADLITRLRSNYTDDQKEKL